MTKPWGRWVKARDGEITDVFEEPPDKLPEYWVCPHPDEAEPPFLTSWCQRCIEPIAYHPRPEVPINTPKVCSNCFLAITKERARE
jgi:predicted nucleic acid-binding Zn ribbon protein